MKLTVETTLEPKQLAELFRALNDEEQAQFFIEASAIARATFVTKSQAKLLLDNATRYNQALRDESKVSS